MGNGAIITNQAGFTFDTSFDGTMSQDFGGAATFNNAGTFTKSAGAGITTLASGVTFNNATGFVNANSGTLRLSGPGTHTGAFNADAGATMNFNGGTHAIDAGASFAGAGTTSITGATMPGSSRRAPRTRCSASMF